MVLFRLRESNSMGLTMKECGTVFRVKHLKMLGVMVGIITARYFFIEGGVKGYIILTNMSTMEKFVLTEIAIPNGKVIDVKNILNTMFDTLIVK